MMLDCRFTLLQIFLRIGQVWKYYESGCRVQAL